MEWFSINERLPEVDERTGESEFVLVYPGHRCLPRIARYSNGLCCKQGWWMQTIGEHHSLRNRRGHPAFTHWAEIEYPDTTNQTNWNKLPDHKDNKFTDGLYISENYDEIESEIEEIKED